MLRDLAAALALLLAPACAFAAPTRISVDTGECGEDTAVQETLLKSKVWNSANRGFSIYAEIAYRRFASGEKKSGCHVEYRLFAAERGKAFSAIEHRDWDTEDGEIAGIDLIGSSADGSKFAADFWLAEGDGVEHRPVVYDRTAGQALYMPLENKIQSRIHGCDQNEDFIGVSNGGEAVFAIPASVYDDSAQCGDKGLWRFNLKTGQVYQVAKRSGDKWQ